MIQAMVSCGRVSEGYGGFLVRQQGLTAALLHFSSQFENDTTRVEFRGRDIPTRSICIFCNESLTPRMLVLQVAQAFNIVSAALGQFRTPGKIAAGVM
jgi:hypothetical protein